MRSQPDVRGLLQREVGELLLSGSAAKLASSEEAGHLSAAQQEHGSERLQNEAMPLQQEDAGGAAQSR